MKPSLAAATVVAVAAGLGGAGGPADASHGCRPGERDVVTRTAEALVFTKGTYRQGRVDRPFYYACHIDTGSTFRLNGRDDVGIQDVDHATIALSGRFVAFVRLINSAGPLADTSALRVMDLATGDLRGTGSTVGHNPAVVLRRDGAATATVGPVAARGSFFPARVMQVDARGRARTLDSGDISLSSLALSHDRETVFWIRDDRPQAALSG